jgi:hypothetical protein
MSHRGPRVQTKDAEEDVRSAVERQASTLHDGPRVQRGRQPEMIPLPPRFTNSARSRLAISWRTLRGIYVSD